jgi:hypothetical protein
MWIYTSTPPYAFLSTGTILPYLIAFPCPLQKFQSCDGRLHTVIYGLYSNTVSSPAYETLNGRMVSE